MWACFPLTSPTGPKGPKESPSHSRVGNGSAWRLWNCTGYFCSPKLVPASAARQSLGSMFRSKGAEYPHWVRRKDATSTGPFNRIQARPAHGQFCSLLPDLSVSTNLAPTGSGDLTSCLYENSRDGSIEGYALSAILSSPGCLHRSFVVVPMGPLSHGPCGMWVCPQQSDRRQ